MKRILLAATAAFAFAAAQPTIAADAPVYKGPAPAAALFNWTGFYLGGQIGYAWARDRQDLFTNAGAFLVTTDNSFTGFVGGGHAGFNMQSGQLVYGVEVDFEGKSLNTSFPVGAPFAATTFTVKSDWQGSIRGRLGLAVDRALLYATGGVTFANYNHTYTTVPGFFDSVTKIRTGWTVGAGLEWVLAANWTARAEYRYTDFGTVANNLPNFLAPPGFSNDRLVEQAVRFALSWKM